MNELDIIQSVILGARHKYYKSTVKQSNFGEEVTTGKGQESYIIRLKREWNESKLSDRHKEEVEHAKVLYNSATPAAYRKLAGYFERVFRVDKAANSIRAKDKNELSERFKMELDNFGGTTVLNYLETNYLFLNGVDPNAWLLLDKTMTESGERIEPMIIRSKDALDYKEHLGELKYLAVQSGLTRGDKELKEWFFYFKSTKYRVIEDDDTLTNEDKEGLDLIKIDKKSYWLSATPTGLNKVAAIRWGYMFNYETNGQTYSYFWDAAKNMMRDLMDRKFQLDMSYMLHTFLQKVQYGDRCTYHDDTRECQGGYMSGSNTKCPSCKGTGIKAHKDASDIIVIAWPEEGDGKVQIAPNQIASYITLPFDIVEEQRNQVNSLPIRMTEAVLGTDLDKTSSGITTATEVNSKGDLTQDKLSTFADGLTHIHSFVVDCVAKMSGINSTNYENSLSYPNEFGLESMDSLLKTLKDAKDANASYSIIRAIEQKIAAKQNKGNKAALDFDSALNMLKPFKQLTNEQVESKLSLLPETNKFKVAYEFFDLIGQDIKEREPNFTLMARPMQKAFFDVVVAEYVQLVRAEQEANRDVFLEEIEDLE